MRNELRTDFVIGNEGDAFRTADRFGESLKKLNSDINALGKDSAFAGKLSTDFDKLQQKADNTSRSFQKIAAARLDAGNIGNLTGEIIRASERSRQLQNDIANIKRELANPNRTSSIAFLTEELQAAEREADQLNRKLNSLPSGAAVSGGSSSVGAARRSGGDLKLSSFQKQNLAYQINDVATMAAMGANPAQILASQGGQIAQIFSPAQIAAFTAAYGSLVTVLGAGAVAIGLTYKITGDMRAEAERRLKVEEMIAGAQNKQILAGQQVLKNLQEQRAERERDRILNNAFANDSDDLLKARKATLEKFVNLAPTGLNAARNVQDILAIEDELNRRRSQNRQQRSREADKAFADRWEAWKKSQEDAIEAEKRAAEKRAESIEKGKEKVKELEKTYREVFNNLFVQTGAENPFVRIFSDGKKAVDDLKGKIKGLPSEMQAAALEMQRALNARQLFDARLGGALGGSDLRRDAANFRNPFDAGKVKNEEEEFVQRFLRNNPNYLFLQNKTELDDAARRDILARGIFDSPQKRLNERIERDYQTIYGSGKLSADEQAIADRQFISRTQGINPLDLSNSNREQAAQAREREAMRRERYEQDALKIYEQQRDLQIQIAANTAKMSQIAEQQGSKGVEIILKNESDSQAKQIAKRPTPADTAAVYQFDGFGLGGGTNR